MSGYEIDQAHQEVIGAIEVHIADLAEMDANEQLKFMREWFLANYEDPANSLPYESREGGYIWIDGGPYYPHEELHGKFGEFVPEEVIERLGDELLHECYEWTAQIDPSDHDSYGFDYIAEPAEYFDEYRLAMDNNQALLAIDVPDSVKSTFLGMVFVNLITSMGNLSFGHFHRSGTLVPKSLCVSSWRRLQNSRNGGSRLQRFTTRWMKSPRRRENTCGVSFGIVLER